MKSKQLIFAKELSKVLGQSEKTARRLLGELERKHGTSAVTRVGRERCTTWGALERFTGLRREGHDDPYDAGKLLTTVRRVLSVIAGVTNRLDELESSVDDLRVRVMRGCMHSARTNAILA